nr:J215 [uncultured bacterium]
MAARGSDVIDVDHRRDDVVHQHNLLARDQQPALLITQAVLVPAVEKIRLLMAVGIALPVGLDL